MSAASSTSRRPAPAHDEAFAADILEGLARTPRQISPKWLYDETGSALFDRICTLPEYPVTRVETALLTRHADEIGGAICELVGPGAVLFEPGAGTGAKAAIILDAMKARAYAPADINPDHLNATLGAMRARFPGRVLPPTGLDMTRSLALPPNIERLGPVVAFFPGSTIGNFAPEDAADLLARFRSQSGARAVLVGFDGVKPEDRMIAAYDDAAGVTAAFNLNLITRINREAAGTLDPDGFAHAAVWNAAHARIEMHLVSRRDQIATIAGQRIAFAAGEHIVTEHSRKFTPDAVIEAARAAGWSVARSWTAPGDDAFTLALLA